MLEFSEINAVNFGASASGIFSFSGRARIKSPSTNAVMFQDNTETSASNLILGLQTNSFPMIKRNGAGIDFRVADDSAACNIGALNITALAGLAAYSTIEGYSTSQAASLRGSVRVGSLGSNDASAILDVVSTTKGFLPPRMTTAQKVGIATPATGLVVFDTDLGKLCVFAVTWQTITSV